MVLGGHSPGKEGEQRRSIELHVLCSALGPMPQLTKWTRVLRLWDL